jgi:hypothetical protein
MVGGIDLSTLGDQFGGYTPGRTLIVDADGPAYAAAATVKTLSTGLRKFQSMMLTQMFLAQAERLELHLTASTSHKAGRFNIIAAKPYQGNRDGKAKPALLEPLRQAIAHESNWLPEYTATMHHLLEADDGMIQSAYVHGENGVIWSEDKDLRLTPYNYFCRKTNTIIKVGGFGSLYMDYTSSGSAKCLGYGPKFFWAQMLMGDTADNIQGVKRLDGKLCGPVAAFNYLDKWDTENACANQVIDAYRAIDQNPIPEGWLLWLLRREGDTFWIYLNELDWTPANRAFLDDCVRRVWFKAPQPKDEEFEDVPY